MTENSQDRCASLALRGEGPHQLPQKRSLPSYRFYGALQQLKSPMRYVCEIFEVPRFSSFSHNPPEAAVRPGSLFFRSDNAGITPHDLCETVPLGPSEIPSRVA